MKTHFSKISPPIPVHQQPHLSLISQNIRLAYLHALYLDDQAFTDVAAPYYIYPSSSNSLVRAAMAPSLRTAALEQLIGSQASSSPSPKLDLERLCKDADDAFEALSTLLGDHEWFTSGSGDHTSQPGILDASVYAYTHVILTLFSSLSEDSPGEKLRASIIKRSNLLDHHGRIAKRYYHAPR
jgi:metaxin